MSINIDNLDNTEMAEESRADKIVQVALNSKVHSTLLNIVILA